MTTNFTDLSQSPVAASNAATPALSIDSLSKTYYSPFHRLRQRLHRPLKPHVVALSNVSFTVSAGEVFGLLGRNGAGKTTLAKIIATLVQPTTGSAAVYGYDSLRDENRVKSLIGLATAEERNSYWRLTVDENLLFFARIYGMPEKRARERIDELIDYFELREFARRRFGELSTGNKQRVTIARSLLIQPPMLLLDEPTRSMDPLAAAKMRRLISGLARETPPVTVLLTSHNLSEVEELCDRVAIIDAGSIRAIDAPQSLCTAHGISETVQIVIHQGPSDLLSNELELLCGPVKFEVVGDDTRITLSRSSGDSRLDDAIRLVQKLGGRIVSIETTSVKLLDVLERLVAESDSAGSGL